MHYKLLHYFVFGVFGNYPCISVTWFRQQIHLFQFTKTSHQTSNAIINGFGDNLYVTMTLLFFVWSSVSYMLAIQIKHAYVTLSSLQLLRHGTFWWGCTCTQQVTEHSTTPRRGTGWAKAWNRLGKGLKQVGQRCGTGWAKAWNRLGKGLEQVGQRPGTGWAKAWNRLGKGLEQVGQRPGTGWAKAWNRLGKGLKQVGQRRGTGWAKAWNRLGKGLEQVGQRPGTGWAKAWNRLGKGLEQVGQRPGTGWAKA